MVLSLVVGSILVTVDVTRSKIILRLLVRNELREHASAATSPRSPAAIPPIPADPVLERMKRLDEGQSEIWIWRLSDRTSKTRTEVNFKTLKMRSTFIDDK